MKKFIFTFLMIFAFAINVNAQIQIYRTTSYAFAKIVNGKYYWGDWEDSSLNISFNLDNDVIIIYSPRTQIYKIQGRGDTFTDSSGGKQVKFVIIDQDGDRGNIRLRIESNGNSQIYIDFADCAWVYNVYRTS